MILLGLHEEKKKIARDKIQLKRAAALVDEKDAVLRRFEELPAWVGISRISEIILQGIFLFQIMFPDVDRAEWLNKVGTENADMYFCCALLKQFVFR